MPRGGAKVLAIGLPLALLSAASLVGTLLAPRLLAANPLLLVALSPRAAYLAVAAGRVPLGAYLVVGLARMLAADPFNFALGSGVGPALRGWAGRRSGTGGCARARAARWSGRAGLPLVALSPTAKVLALAGASGLRWPAVAAADVAGSLAQLLVLYVAGRSMADPCRHLVAVVVGHGALVAGGVAVVTAVGLASLALPALDARRRHRRCLAHPVFALHSAPVHLHFGPRQRWVPRLAPWR